QPRPRRAGRCQDEGRGAEGKRVVWPCSIPRMEVTGSPRRFLNYNGANRRSGTGMGEETPSTLPSESVLLRRNAVLCALGVFARKDAKSAKQIGEGFDRPSVRPRIFLFLSQGRRC